MASKNKSESKTKPEIKKDHFETLLENMNDSIKLVAEGQAAFREEVNQRFDEIDQRFVGVDQRFDEIDQRFVGVDQRFDEIDQRFVGVDQRLDGIDQRLDGIDQRLDGIDQRLDGIDQRFDEADQRFTDFRDETRANFKTVFDYLSRIDSELQDIKKRLERLDETKVDKCELDDLAQRVARLERKLEECKDSLEAKK